MANESTVVPELVPVARAEQHFYAAVIVPPESNPFTLCSGDRSKFLCELKQAMQTCKAGALFVFVNGKPVKISDLRYSMQLLGPDGEVMDLELGNAPVFLERGEFCL